jgi:hypothetical protein
MLYEVYRVAFPVLTTCASGTRLLGLALCLPSGNTMTRPENDESVIEQARAWLLRSRRWAQRGLDRLANAEEVLTDRESVADFAEAAGYR